MYNIFYTIFKSDFAFLFFVVFGEFYNGQAIFQYRMKVLLFFFFLTKIQDPDAILFKDVIFQIFLSQAAYVYTSICVYYIFDIMLKKVLAFLFLF